LRHFPAGRFFAIRSCGFHFHIVNFISVVNFISIINFIPAARGNIFLELRNNTTRSRARHVEIQRKGSKIRSGKGKEKEREIIRNNKRYANARNTLEIDCTSAINISRILYR